MLAWMIYVIVVSLLLGLAAVAFEHSARLRQKPTRWLWGMSMIASLAVPFAISSVSVQIPRMTNVADPAISEKIVALRQITASELSPSAWLIAGTGQLSASPGLDRLLEGAWRGASIALLLAIIASGAQLLWRQRRWERGNMVGTCVYISEDSGPAVVGLVYPHIVVPRWLTKSSPGEQELVIAHEQSHLEAYDAQLLLIALCLLVCMPWNLPLWWQLRRLRFAVEIDCDARVLRRGHDVSRYGETLIRVGERQSANIGVVAAMSESFLEQRIQNILRKRTRGAWAPAMALACLGAVLAAGAAEVSPPNANNAAKPLHQETDVDAAMLDGYVGFYQLGDNAVLTVTRDGRQLAAQVTGQPAYPIYPQSNTEFFYKVVDAQISFFTDAKGQATSLILHQGGSNFAMKRIDATTAQQIASKTAEKVKSQSASAGTEAALRRLVAGIISGKPNYGEMSPALAEATRHQLPNLQPWLTQLGAIESVKFLGVGSQGEDVYTVTQESGASHWRIALDSKGAISMALVTPGP
jgi:beta-lactamase regulating signal transducer with metallopeptidase domain